MGRKTKTLTYDTAFKIWKTVEHIDEDLSKGKWFRIERTWLIKESGEHDSPHTGIEKLVGRRRSLIGVDGMGVYLTSHRYYPFFVLTPIKRKIHKVMAK